MKKMKKRCLFAFLLLVLLFPMRLSAMEGNDTTPFNWYCKNNKEHIQPSLDSNLQFIQEYGGYYIDPTATEEDKVLYLTFDAGYENGNIAKILDVLKKHEAKGAFFVLENLIKRDTPLVTRMIDEGHFVCNHTKSHPDMTKMTTQEQFAKQLQDLEAVYTEYTGKELAKFYRPPEGRFSAQNLKYANDMGYKTIFWSFAYADWDNEKQMTPEAAKNKVLQHTHNGAVILLHPTSATNAAILDDLLTEWESQGYRFGTLDALTNHEK